MYIKRPQYVKKKRTFELYSIPINGEISLENKKIYNSYVLQTKLFLFERKRNITEKLKTIPKVIVIKR